VQSSAYLMLLTGNSMHGSVHTASEVWCKTSDKCMQATALL